MGDRRGGDSLRDAEAERLLSDLRFVPRASLGPEIAGRARRGEIAEGGLARRRTRVARWLMGTGTVAITLALAALAHHALRAPERLADHCCRNLDGGPDEDDGYVVTMRGRRVERLTLYEDRDGNRRFSAADRVLLVRGKQPLLTPDSVLSTIRICCEDLDGEGPADDGLLVMNAAEERVVLAGIFETRARHPSSELR